MSDKILEVSDLQIRYVTDEETVRAVNGVSFTLERGESIGLVGETGAGKTTTALGIMGLVPDPPGEIVGGSILFEDQDLLKLPEKQMREIRGGKISMIFQDPMTSLNHVMTVGAQIAEVVLLHNKISKAEARERAKEMLEQVGIPGSRCDDYPHQFSGGMKQRVMIAIALACRPAVLIADEPTTALDCVVKQQVIELFHSINEQQHVAIIMISHDLNLIRRYCDKVAVMYAGQIVESGGSNEVFSQPQHPYTQALLSVIPRLDQDRNVRLNEIPGYVPEHGRDTSHCLFQPRCSACRQECGGSVKSSRRDGHFVRCSKAWEECRA